VNRVSKRNLCFLPFALLPVLLSPCCIYDLRFCWLNKMFHFILKIRYMWLTVFHVEFNSLTKIYTKNIGYITTCLRLRGTKVIVIQKWNL
jgi:hypothetical protein